nr:ATP-binding protein [Desulfobacterales bacterium]
MELKDITFVLQECDSSEAYGDRDVLLRVLLNLIGNAIKFAWSGTRIDFEIRKEKDKVCGDTTGWLEVVMSDRCPAIPREYHESIFERYNRGPDRTQKEKAGRGIGFYFCRLAIESHGGTIWFESPIAGKKTGVVVHFTLPTVERVTGAQGEGSQT